MRRKNLFFFFFPLFPPLAPVYPFIWSYLGLELEMPVTTIKDMLGTQILFQLELSSEIQGDPLKKNHPSQCYLLALRDPKTLYVMKKKGDTL